MSYCVRSSLPICLCPSCLVPTRSLYRGFLLQTLTEKVDIYSMGMLFFSLTSGELPFDHDEDGKNKILKGEKPVFDAYWPAGYMEVSGGCCLFSPLERCF